MTGWLCRDCLRFGEGEGPARRCDACGSPRLLRHPELGTLSLAHLDCDAFYAAIEKRDDPSLANRPVIVGGGRRGVVSAACYVARTYGIHSAMPMFKALKACPEAVVLRPDMEKYAAVGRQVRALMREVTPLVEPLALDEAFLDLGGTERLHRQPAATTLAALARRIEHEIGITASIGLSYNKFLAKVASELDKPRGFAVLGRAEAADFLAPRPVSLIWGVGKALQKRLAADGIATIAQLRRHGEQALVARYGAMGHRLYHFARGEDRRAVVTDAPAKSVSAETTFDEDIAGFEALDAILWPLCEKVARRLKRAALSAHGVTLKLKTGQFRIRTRSTRLAGKSQLAEELYRAARRLLEAEADGTAYRLIGVAAGQLDDAAGADAPDLLDPGAVKRAAVEHAIDAVRDKLGGEAIGKGRGLRRERRDEASSRTRGGTRAGSRRRRR